MEKILIMIFFVNIWLILNKIMKFMRKLLIVLKKKKRIILAKNILTKLMSWLKINLRYLKPKILKILM